MTITYASAPSQGRVATINESQSITSAISIIRQLSELNETLMTSLNQSDAKRVKETERADAAEKKVRALTKEVMAMKEEVRIAKNEQLKISEEEKKVRLEALEELEVVRRKLKGVDEKAPRDATKTKQGNVPERGIDIVEPPKRMIAALKKKPQFRLRKPREVAPTNVDIAGDLSVSQGKRTLGDFLPETRLADEASKRARTQSTYQAQCGVVSQPSIPY